MCNYTKNNDPNYFDEYPDEGNCGSFALNVREWYISDRDFDNTTIAYDMMVDDVDLDVILDYLTFKNVEQILEDFSDEIRVLTNKEEVKDNEELIAYRIGIFNYEDMDYLETDFHFKVKRNGSWMEKPGSTDVKYCDLEEFDNWSNSSGDIYNGPIVFFAKKI